MNRATLLVACLLAPLHLAPAQGQVIVVDDDGGAGVHYTQLQDAIDAAADGDVLLLKPGQYAPPQTFPQTDLIVDDKALLMIGEDPANTHLGPLRVINLDASRTFTMRGLITATAPLTLSDNAGTLWFEDCQFTTSNFQGDPIPVRVDDCDAVHFNRCRFQGGMNLFAAGSGMIATDSNMHLYDSALSAADGYTIMSTGGDGILVDGGFLFASDTPFVGGSGGCGGNGVRLMGNAPVAWFLGSQRVAGTPVQCSFGPFGVPLLVATGSHTDLSGSVANFEITSPHRAGDTATLSFEGTPGDQVFLFFAGGPNSAFLPALRGVFQLSPLFVGTFYGSLDSNGELATSFTVPNLGVPSHVLYLQAIHYSAAGGAVLSGGSVLAVLGS